MSKSAQHNALKKHFCERNYLYINDVIITDADSEFVKTFSIPAFSKDGIFDIFVHRDDLKKFSEKYSQFRLKYLAKFGEKLGDK